MTSLQFLIAARWVHFAAVFILFGAALFWFYAPGDPARGVSDLPRSFTATRRLLRVAAPLAAVSGLAWLAGIIVNMTSDPATPDWSSLRDPEALRLFFFETNFGGVSIIRLVLLAAAVGVVAVRLSGRRLLFALVPIGGGLLMTQAWLGHAAEGGAGWKGSAMIAAYGAHVLAAAAWTGGLAPLLFVLVEQRRRAKDPAAANSKVLARFSAMGTIAVALIVASGAANAGFRVGGAFSRLFDTAYGDVLCAKLAFVALMLALAYFNRFVAMPRLRVPSRENAVCVKALTLSIAAELALGVLVLGAAAALGVTPPPQ